MLHTAFYTPRKTLLLPVVLAEDHSTLLGHLLRLFPTSLRLFGDHPDLALRGSENSESRSLVFSWQVCDKKKTEPGQG